MKRAFWQLPAGVGRGTWDYLRSDSIAKGYESYLADHPLFSLDIDFVKQLLQRETKTHPESLTFTFADFGSGTGRVARTLGPLFPNCRFLNIDLSSPMLMESQNLALANSRAVHLRGNLADLKFLKPGCVDLGVCLFSSIGMIRGRDFRINFLEGVRKSLKSGAPFILHAHNRYQSLLDPGGIIWLMRSFVQSCLHRDHDFGDRVYQYRGLPSMFLHIYSRRELLSDLSSAGFRKIDIHEIAGRGDKLLEKSRANIIRAGGFFVVAE